MFCNGLCNLCSAPCFRGEQKEIVQNDFVQSKAETEQTEKVAAERGLAVPETVKYEVVKNIFGKEKVRRVQ